MRSSSTALVESPSKCYVSFDFFSNMINIIPTVYDFFFKNIIITSDTQVLGGFDVHAEKGDKAQ